MRTTASYFLSALALLAAGGAGAGTVISQGTGNWGTAGTWNPGLPGPGDDVYIATGHTVTISGMSMIEINSLSVSGVLNHAQNTSTETNKVRLKLTGSLTIPAGGSVNVSGRGFNTNVDPRGTHGGVGGGRFLTDHVTAFGAYGSVVAPTNVGTRYAGSGGGAIWIEAGGAATVDGSLNANGLSAGAGGSVYLRATTLAGGGTISADGSAGDNPGGGGRVAVVLTAGDSFDGVTMSAYGGLGVGHSGACGTVYRQTATQGDGNGMLVIDNGTRLTWERKDMGGWAARARVTEIPAGQTWGSSMFGTIEFHNGGRIGVFPGTTLDLSGVTVVRDSSGKDGGIFLWGGTLVAPADYAFDYGVWLGTNSIWASTSITVQSGGAFIADVPCALSNVTVAAGGKITHASNYDVEYYKLQLTVDNNLTVALGGAIDVTDRGFYKNVGPYTGNAGGAYGGQGRDRIPAAASTAKTHGSVLAPDSQGSDMGGGLARLQVGGATVLDGTIKADGGASGGAGGGVYLRTGTLSGDGTIQANGNGAGDDAGGAGRIAVVLTGGTGFGGVTMQAYGGVNGFGKGAAGTIYLQTADEAERRGQVFIDSSTFNDPYTATILLPEADAVADELAAASLIVTNASRLKLSGGPDRRRPDRVRQRQPGGCPGRSYTLREHTGALS